MKQALKEPPFRHSAHPIREARGKLRRAAPQGGITALVNDSPLLVAQRKQLQSLFGTAAQRQEDARSKSNNTGLPDHLKSGIESLSGLSMDHVKVHYNSSLPAQLNALAYAQGRDIHVAPGQEQHLPHEAWHVVQQAQGRVKPTMQMAGGMAVNTDKGLEREADAMGARAAQTGNASNLDRTAERLSGGRAVIQKLDAEKLNVVGEDHDESGKRRERETAYCNSAAPGGYWLENEFEHGGEQGDDRQLRNISLLDKTAKTWEYIATVLATLEDDNPKKSKTIIELILSNVSDILPRIIKTALFIENNEKLEKTAKKYEANFKATINLIHKMGAGQATSENVVDSMLGIIVDLEGRSKDETEAEAVDQDRSEHMHRVANLAQEAGRRGVWKVGNDHVSDIKSLFNDNKYHLETQSEFNGELVAFENDAEEKAPLVIETPGVEVPEEHPGIKRKREPGLEEKKENEGLGNKKRKKI